VTINVFTVTSSGFLLKEKAELLMSTINRKHDKCYAILYNLNYLWLYG